MVVDDGATAVAFSSDSGPTDSLWHHASTLPHLKAAFIGGAMRGHGGFEHNRQSLRIVELLEQKYPRFSGLNLSWEVREGLMKHQTAFDHPAGRGRIAAKSPSLEAQVANLADEITYYSHDLDDGLDSRLLSEEQLRKNVQLWKVANQSVEREYGKLPDECRRYFIIRCIIDMQVKDVVETTEKHLLASGVRSADEVRLLPSPLVRHTPERRRQNLDLRRYLYKNLYFNPVVHQPNLRAVRMLGTSSVTSRTIPASSEPYPASASERMGCIAQCVITSPE